jgi:hypothetical protein
MTGSTAPQSSERLDTPAEHLDVRWMGATVKVPDHIMHRSFPAETVLLNLKSGTYHGLNHTAGRILQELDEIGSVAEVTRKLAADYEQPVSRVQADVCRLCQSLFDRGVIERVSQR